MAATHFKRFTGRGSALVYGTRDYEIAGLPSILNVQGPSALLAPWFRRRAGTFWRCADDSWPLHPSNSFHPVWRNGSGLLHGTRATGPLSSSEPGGTGRALLFHFLLFCHGWRRCMECRSDSPAQYQD